MLTGVPVFIFRERTSLSIHEEQRHLDQLLALIATRRDTLEARLKDVRKEADIDDPQGLMMRDREAADITARLQTLTAADVGLMFGRIDVEDPTDDDPDNPVMIDGTVVDRRYIGRIGVHDNDEAMRTLLMDWRAPQARPFYLATTLHPQGVHTRRHIKTRGHKVISSSDETLIARGTSAGDAALATTGGGVGQEQALLDAVNAARTPHMRDIVETIAAEQDTIIRSPYRGVTIVQGAPGTGKTAVALHRAAYLLYTWREQLANTGVLIIGPNARFLNYISQVLPSLGETGVVLATPGTLLPGVSTIPEENLLAREVKGSVEMVHILASAVKTWQTVPDEPLEFVVDGISLSLTPAHVRAARTRARRSRKPHNQARSIFINHALDTLTDLLAERIGADPLGGQNLLSGADKAQLRDDLGTEPDVVEAVGELWPELTPEKVLRRLYTDPDNLAEATAEYDESTRAGLTSAGQWTDADAPLLDELSDLLGVVDNEESAEAEREEWREAIADAQDALDILTGSASQDLDDGFDAEILMAYDIVDAEALAKRHTLQEKRTTAERAAADIRWAFGHIIVDEAQELSEMAWRMVFRRSPNRWMTLVGDPAQTGNPAGVDQWSQTLSPFVGDRWKLHELTVNYRTPRDISEVANSLLADIAPDQDAPVALRESGTDIRQISGQELFTALPEIRQRAGEGLVGVISATSQASSTLESALQEHEVGIDEHVIFCDISAAKGLEFDEVVVVEPAEFLEASPQGLNDVYVALTRATQGLTIVNDGGFEWDNLPPIHSS
ncbi:AAA family ATPase [Corynebacterium sp. 320]|uniref:HelD family protein n=1 Tax=Corynebacterium TaxID=1716 RepID=UPI00125CB4F7|nr:AAA family ATPase [Corynebacterium sp. 320]KAB3526213.1 AAA family ATPase [Corynebacterium sp. 250]QNP93180.1 AAA family ATPase [Corynebacterium zhongnanshanii]